jgi:hypothetical protein
MTVKALFAWQRRRHQARSPYTIIAQLGDSWCDTTSDVGLEGCVLRIHIVGPPSALASGG